VITDFKYYNIFATHHIKSKNIGFTYNLFFLLLLSIYSCKKEDAPPASPILYTGEAVSVTKDGAEFTGNFKNVDPDRVVAYGFVLHEQGEEKVQKTRYISLPLPFTNEIATTFSYSLKKDVVYVLQTFVTYPGKTYFGNPVSFLSLGSRTPVINKVSSAKINFGDTLKLNVSYLDVDPANLKAFFNNEEGEIIYYSDSLLTVKVPYFKEVNTFFSDGIINLYLNKLNFFSDTSLLELLPPVIYDTIPGQGYSASELVLNGRGFHPDLGQLMLGSHELRTVSVTNHSIKTQLPPLYQDFEGELRYTFKLKKSRTNTLSYKIGYIKVIAPYISHFNKDSLRFNDTLTLYGKYLDNEMLSFLYEGRFGDFGYGIGAPIIERYNDSIMIMVPERVCTSVKLSYYFIGFLNALEDHKFLRSFNIREPNDISVRVENDVSGYPYRRAIISSKYFPNADFSVYQDEKRLEAQLNISPTGIESDLLVNASPNAIIPDGWVHLDLHFCETSFLTLDSVVQIPAPVIEEISDTVKTTKKLIIKGNYFNEKGWLNELFIDGVSIGNFRAQNANEIEVELDFQLKTGLHTLKIATNGQFSNTVPFYLVNPWQKITNTPGPLGNMPVSFFLNDKIYVGGGVHSRDYNFYEYDMIAENWTKKRDLPVYEGVSYNDDTYCFLSHFKDFYQYIPDNDQWIKKSSIPSEFSPNIEYPCFLFDGQFFVFKLYNGGYHTYNIAKDKWTNKSSNIYIKAFTSVALNRDTAWFIMDNGAYTYDLNQQQFNPENLNRSIFKSGLESIVGIHYNNQLYFYNDGQWMIFNTDNFERHRIRGPRSYADYVKVFRDGNCAYVILDNSIWKCNLDLIH